MREGRGWSLVPVSFTQDGAQETEQAGRGNKNTLAWLNHCLREVVDRDTIVISEYSFRQEYCPLETPGSLYAVSAAGGLGWGFGASLGAKLASPERIGSVGAR